MQHVPTGKWLLAYDAEYPEDSNWEECASEEEVEKRIEELHNSGIEEVTVAEIQRFARARRPAGYMIDGQFQKSL